MTIQGPTIHCETASTEGEDIRSLGNQQLTSSMGPATAKFSTSSDYDALSLSTLATDCRALAGSSFDLDLGLE